MAALLMLSSVSVSSCVCYQVADMMMLVVQVLPSCLRGWDRVSANSILIIGEQRKRETHVVHVGRNTL